MDSLMSAAKAAGVSVKDVRVTTIMATTPADFDMYLNNCLQQRRVIDVKYEVVESQAYVRHCALVFYVEEKTQGYTLNPGSFIQ